MADAFLNGRAVSFDQAVEGAVRLFAGARAPLVSGLAADTAAIGAALALARRLGAAVDHVHGRTLAMLAGVLASTGTLSATPGEVRARSDVLLLTGPQGDGALLGYVAAGAATTVVAVGADVRRLKRDGRRLLTVPASGDGEILAALASIKAALAGRLPNPPRAIAQAAEALGGAAYGAALYDPSSIGEPALTLLMALVNSLNATSRFTSMALPVPGNGMGALLVSGWTAGCPLPFGHRSDGETDHDPLRYDTARLVASGACDAVLWLDTLGTGVTAPVRRAPCVTIAAEPVHGADVSFVAGVPGRDHDGVLYRAEIATLAHHPATAGSNLPVAADVISAIAAALPKRPAKEARR
jgi:formylmethanofuran dehydrogenase subunit B